MGITRTFVGWEQPVLPRAVAHLIDRYASDDACDLGNVIAVVPGRRAGRRLLELLVDIAADRFPDFVPPQIETAGTLPELLFVNRLQYADVLTCNLVWAEALRNVDGRTLRGVVPEPPSLHDFDAWMGLADLIRKQHRELASEGLDFEDAAIACQKANEKSEAKRWFALRAVQQDYHNRMDEIRYWDRQTARIEAVRRDEIEIDRDIVLIGAVDLNQAVKNMLVPIGHRVTALVAAPNEHAGRFDEFGTLIADEWTQARLDLRSEQVQVVDRPDDQAAAAVAAITNYEGRYRADEITIGVADDRLIPHLQRHFDECNVATRWFDGQHLDQTPPYRLFQLLAEFIAGLLPGDNDAKYWNFESFASLVRHPDLFDWIEANFAAPPPSEGGRERHWLVQLDEYRADHLQPYPGYWLPRSYNTKSLSMLWTRIGDLVAEFAPANERGTLFPEIRRLDEWVEPIRAFLLAVYKKRNFQPDDMSDTVAAAAIRRFDEILFDFDKVPKDILPEVNAAHAIRLMLNECVGEFIPPPRDDEAIELLGWLELTLDDAPALVVTTFNEQFVPQSSAADIFLPNQLRQRLNLNDNTHRYARDCYAMHVLLASREDLTLVVGRRDDNNDPLTPSRLLFATDPQDIPARVLDFYPERAEPNTLAQRSRLFSEREDSGFVVPEPSTSDPLTSLTVSQFKSYLRCPYRFYLNHVLRLRESDDTPREMHPGQFGTVIHDVLDHFGRDTDIRDALNAEDIQSYLVSELDKVVKRRFGVVRTAAANVQIQRIRMRLEAFAEWQARWASFGYRIRYAEENDKDAGSDRVPFDLGDGESIEVVGRIDRIDQKRDTDEWVIFDYKTSDAAKAPAETHLRGHKNLGKARWVDLQLPLYRHLARALPTECGQNYKVGYILLPGDLFKIGQSIAKWTVEDFAEADELSRDIGQQVLAKRFWPPAPSVEYPDFERICQDAVFDRAVLA